MQNEISIEQRLGRIEQLLLGQKNVIPHYKPNGKNIFFNRSELES